MVIKLNEFKALLNALGVEYSNGDLVAIFGFDYKKNSLNKSKDYKTTSDIMNLLEDVRVVFGVDLKSKLLGGVA